MTETDRMLVNLLTAVIILICIILVGSQESYTAPRLGQLVPTIRQDYYELVPTEDKYYLRLDLPNGGSRVENVELLSDENGKNVLAIKGTLNLIYRDTPLQVTVIYEADGNGYRAKYVYAPMPIAIPPVAFASANLLKSAAG